MVASRVLILIGLVLVGSCQRTSSHVLWDEYAYDEAITISQVSFIENRGVSLSYVIENSNSNPIYYSSDLINSPSSVSGIIELKNSFGMKVELYVDGFKLSTLGYDKLLPDESADLNIKRWKYPIWYPKWLPGQKR